MAAVGAVLLSPYLLVLSSAAKTSSPPLWTSSSSSSSNNPNFLLLSGRQAESTLILRPQRRTSAQSSIPLLTSSSSIILVFHRELGIDQRESDALLRKHPALALAAADSLRRLILSLRSLGLTALALRRPEILTSPEAGAFLDDYIQLQQEGLDGLRPAKLERLLAFTPLPLLTGFGAGVRLLLDHGVPIEMMGALLNHVDVRKVFCERPLRELEDTIRFLQPYGWPELFLRRPRLLNLDLRRQLVPRVEFLVELGGGDEAGVGVLLRKLPAILAYTVEHFQSHMEFWRSVGLTDDQVFKIALVYPSMFSVSRERKLHPRIGFLQQCGLNADDIYRFLLKAPLFVSLSFEENLSKKLAFLVKLGYRHRTRELALAVGAATRTSCDNMQAVLGLFFGLGFSAEDLLAMSKKHPQVLQYNHRSLGEKVVFLTEEMERDLGELLVFPAFLGYKLDDRIKRRYEAKLNTRGKGMSLNKLLSVAADRFFLPGQEIDTDAVTL